jgi:mannose-6-phosphate isomerase-like protein (cupin superfamily)
MTRLEGQVSKGWGSELIWATNDLYCGKLLNFNTGAKFSMHFHNKKDESWYVLSGSFTLKIINTDNAEEQLLTLKTGDSIRIKPLTPHQLCCLEGGTIIEVSTPDSVEDNYRIAKGDSQ